MTDEIILLGINDLNKEKLLAEKFESHISRRALLQKAAVSAVAIPLLIGLAAPIPAHSQSCLADGQPCNLANPSACCGNFCSITAGGNVCISNTCLPAGSACQLAVPGACCSQRCNIVGNTTMCA